MPLVVSALEKNASREGVCSQGGGVSKRAVDEGLTREVAFEQIPEVGGQAIRAPGGQTANKASCTG